MASTYTDNLRLTLQGDGDNSNTWGQVVNAQVISLVEEAVASVASINCTGSSNVDISATTQNGATDDARHAVLELTGVLGANIQLLLPAVEKIYVIRAAQTGGYTINVRPTGGGSGIDFVTGTTALVYTNGTSIYSVGAADALLAANNLSDVDSVSTARTNLGLGTAAVLDVGTTANKVVQLNGSGQLPAVDGSLLTGLGSGGTMASQNANNVAITGGTITGITDLAVADGGTGASTAANARTNLGLGTMATQNASAVAITGGTITGVTGFPAVTNTTSGKIVIGAVTMQWGVDTQGGGGGNNNVTFGTAFSDTPYSVQCTSSTEGATKSPVSHSHSTTGFFTDNDVSTTFTWLAIGPT